MPTVLYNPGEPVFDQRTGEFFIDPNGDLVEVQPGLIVEGPDGRSLDGDDVANAAFYRANKFEGETLRNIDIGVPFDRLVLGQSNAILAMNAVLSEVRQRTPGVLGILSERVLSYSPINRVLQWTAVLLRADGTEQSVNVQSG